MLEHLCNKMGRLQASLSLAEAQVREEEIALTALKGRLGTLQEAQRVFQALAKEVQQQAHAQIAGIVTRCLKAVFGKDAYEFTIKFEEKRGKTEAHLLFLKNGIEEDPLEAGFGGAVDLASFALRLSCLLLRKPPLRRLLILDEPFKHLSKEYRPAVKDLLESLCEEMGLQIIMVTHAPELRAGKVFNLGEGDE